MLAAPGADDEPPRVSRLLRSQWLIPLAVTLLAFTMTIAAWARLQRGEQEERQLALTREIALISVELRDRLRSHAQFLRGVRAFFATAPGVSPEGWQIYSRQLAVERYLPGTEAYGFAQRVNRADAESFVTAIRQNHRLPDFAIKPQPALDQSFAVLHIAPTSERSARAVGLDLFSESKRRMAIEMARDNDDVALTGRITLRNDNSTQPQPAMIMIMPVFKPGSATRSVEERRQAVVGAVYAAYRISDFIESINYLRTGNVGLRIFDDESYNSGREGSGLTLLFDSFPAGSPDSETLEEREIEFGHRKWLLQFQSTTALPVLRESTLLLGGGLAISLMLGLLTWHLSTRRQQAEAYAKKMNAELLHSEARFQLAAQGANDGLWDRDFGSSEIHVSERLEELLGYPPGSVPNDVNFLLSRIHPDDLPAVRNANRQHLKARQPFDIEYRMLKADKHWGWFHSRGQALWDSTGKAVRMAGSIADISQRKEAEESLRQQHALLQTIIENIPAGVSLIDRNLQFTAANKALLDVLDLPAELFASGSPSFYAVALFNAQRGDYGPGEPEDLANVVIERARHPIPHVFERTRPNGKTIEVRGTPLPDGSFVTIYTDVTERKRAETESLRHREHLSELVAEQTLDLLLAKNAAEKANETKSEFLANMSHEMRTPMHAVLSFAGLGEEKAGAEHAEKLQHYFQRIRQSGERLLRLLNDLLDLAKLEAGKMHVEPLLQDVLPLIREVGAEFESLLTSRRLQLLINEADCSTDAMYDAERFGQVMRNLLSNAIKFSADGGLVTISFARSTQQLGRRSDEKTTLPALRITVSDEGIGIPPKELELIFEKFAQSSMTRNGAGGTGLGLAICREIMHTHRGTIEACNNPVRGASLILHLPSAPVVFSNSTPREIS